MNLKHKGPPYYDHIYNGNTGWNTQELYRRKTIYQEKLDESKGS